MATLILKATEKCNSNCYYCDVVFKQKTGASMSLEVLETVFIRIGEYLKACPHEMVELLWHGGEPLLVGPEYFRSALELQERHCVETRGRIKHSIQTNLTCFTEEFVEVFRGLGITAVGTSYDPEPHMRGAGNDIDSDTYNKKFMKALAILERHGLGWGMIYVVTKKSLAKPLDVFFFLTNLKLTGGINFNPVLIYDSERKDVAVTPEEYAHFLGAIFPHWWKHRHRYPDIQPFKSLVENIIEGKRNPACMEFGVCDSSIDRIVVCPGGETVQNGAPADGELGQLGNIREDTLEELLEKVRPEQHGGRLNRLHDDECRGCRLDRLCRDGRPNYSAVIRRDAWCDARKGFLEQYFEPIAGVSLERAL